MHYGHRSLAAATMLAVFLFAGGLATAQAPSAPPQQTLKEWFQKKDKNGDGKIDREEFYQLAVESFYFRDKNNRGYLTIEELKGASPEAIKAASRSHDNRLTLDEYLNAVFKDFDAADTDHDGTLTFEEIDLYIRSNKK